MPSVIDVVRTVSDRSGTPPNGLPIRQVPCYLIVISACSILEPLQPPLLPTALRPLDSALVLVLTRASRESHQRRSSEDHLTIVVTAKVNDGIVLAADSAASFFGVGAAPVKIYNHANKIFNLIRLWPVGAMVYGTGGIGAASIETLSKDLRAKFSNHADAEYGLDRDDYSIEEVATKARKWLFEVHYRQAFPTPNPDFFLGYRVCGYSADGKSAEVWEFIIHGADCAAPTCLMKETEFGLRWAGENEALDRLFLGASSLIVPVLIEKGIGPAVAADAYLEFSKRAGAPMLIPAMPIQDAIDVARFAVETASRFAKYGMRPETIGGPTELAVITKHEGFKWVSRKHYYSAELNREVDHV